MRFRTAYNYNLLESDMEQNSGIPTEELQPNMALTPREILARFRTGTLPPIEHPSIWDDNFDDLDNLDPTEQGDFDLADATEILASSNALKSMEQYFSQQELERNPQYQAMKAKVAEYEAAMKKQQQQQ